MSTDSRCLANGASSFSSGAARAEPDERNTCHIQVNVHSLILLGVLAVIVGIVATGCANSGPALVIAADVDERGTFRLYSESLDRPAAMRSYVRGDPRLPRLPAWQAIREITPTGGPRSSSRARGWPASRRREHAMRIEFPVTGTVGRPARDTGWGGLQPIAPVYVQRAWAAFPPEGSRGGLARC
jgi:hypothetical protein